MNEKQGAIALQVLDILRSHDDAHATVMTEDGSIWCATCVNLLAEKHAAALAEAEAKGMEAGAEIVFKTSGINGLALTRIMDRAAEIRRGGAS